MGNDRSATDAAFCAVVRTFLVGTTALAGIAGLAGCPTVDLGDTPTEIGLCNPNGGVQYFQDMIWPMFIENKEGSAKGVNTQCDQNQCHVNGGNGLDFPGAPGTVDYPGFYRRTQTYLNCGTPDASELLTKPLAGIDAHGGGDIFPDVTDPNVVIFLNWFK